MYAIAEYLKTASSYAQVLQKKVITIEEYAGNLILSGGVFEYDEQAAQQIVESIPSYAAVEFLSITEQFLLPESRVSSGDALGRARAKCGRA